MGILDEVFKLNPSNLITLYELDLSDCIGKYGAKTTDVYRWCDGVNEVGTDIVFNGVTYSRFPIEASGFDKQGNGSIPRPKLLLSNYGGIVANLARNYNDIVGAKLKRTRTFARYLDSVNFNPKNYFKKSTDFTNSLWTKNNITITTANTTLPFKVGSKVTISGNEPSSYNIKDAEVVNCTTSSITINGSVSTIALTKLGIIQGSEYTATITSVTNTGTQLIYNFTPITTTSPVLNEPVHTITEVETATFQGRNIGQSMTYNAGTTYCMSIYVNPGLRTRFRMEFPAAMFANVVSRVAYFDLSITKGSYFATNTATLNPTIEPLPDFPGWYRCSIAETAEVTANNTYAPIIRLVHSGTTVNYTGNNSLPAMLISAPQITAGSIYTKEYYPEPNATIITNKYADPTQYLDKEVWIVDRKANENSAFIEWELTAPYDLMGVKLPKRQCIQNMCTWKYRGAECGYTGTNYYNIKDEQIYVASQDICGKRVDSCKLRFPNQQLPYGGFPAIGI